MVTAALIGLVFGGVRAVMGLVPQWDPAADPFGSVSSNLAGWVGSMNGYFPVTVLGLCLVLLVSLKVFMLGWRLIVFVYHQFWGAD